MEVSLYNQTLLAAINKVFVQASYLGSTPDLSEVNIHSSQFKSKQCVMCTLEIHVTKSLAQATFVKFTQVRELKQ